MISKPMLEDRKKQPYMGIRTQVSMGQIKKVIPQLLGEVAAWLDKRGVTPAGPPFMRFHVINMAANMDIELGFPVARAVSGDARVSAGVIPAGRYASLVYTGNGIKANKALLDWAAAQGIKWDRWDDKNGDAFRGRIETYLTDPAEEPNRAKWQTEVAIKLADDQASQSDMPAKLSKPAQRALDAAGYTRLEQLTRVTESDLLKLHGLGPKTLGPLRDALSAKGLAFAAPNSSDSSGSGGKTSVPVPKEKVLDSPTGWVRNHIREYVESDGKKGHHWRGTPTLLLTTRGRKSGKLRRTALIYGQDGKRFLLVASNGGASNHPLWYFNLIKNPEVKLQVGADKFAARARTATAREKPRLWQLMVKIFPHYDTYQAKAAKAGRDIPVVIVERI